MSSLLAAATRLIAGASLALLAVACNSTSPGGAVSPGDLAGRWRVDSLVTPAGDATPVPTMAEAFVQFDPTAGTNGGAASGKAGVNTFNTTWSIQGAILAFEPLVLTRMAGPPESMDFEHRLLKFLAEPLHPRLQGSMLILRGAEGAVRLAR